MWAATITCSSTSLVFFEREGTRCGRKPYWCLNSSASYHCNYSTDNYHHHRHCFCGYDSSKFRGLLRTQICCNSDSNSSSPPKPKRGGDGGGDGFGPESLSSTSSTTTTNKAKKSSSNSRLRKSTSQQSGSAFSQAPGIISRTEGMPKNIVSDLEFEERLQAVRRSTLEQKKEEEQKQFGAIDYDAPVEPKSSTIGLGTKIGVGVAVIAFGLVFALGDFLPSGVSPYEESTTVDKQISEEDRAKMQVQPWWLWSLGFSKQLQQFEATLNSSPEDPTALEGAAVTLVELGEYKRAAGLLEDLTKKKPSDPDVFRLLGEVKYELKDYDRSAIAYKNAAKVSKTINLEVLSGLTDALLAAKKPNEAVQVLLESREHLSKDISAGKNERNKNVAEGTSPDMDPIQVDLLLGKAYSDWGHVSDAVSVYDQLISLHPDDFRGYLAKGILLKQNGNIGDAERMFIQARFFAPEKAKVLVDKYAR